MSKSLSIVACLLVFSCNCARAHEITGEALPPGERQFLILKSLPTNPEAYQSPAAELVRAGIPEKYGQEEWAAVVLTHELHQHVGVMTVIGAKMAVFARELLDAPPRAVKVVSETGPEPPFACAMDGLQAGLASTFAQNLIQAPAVPRPHLAAEFEYEGHRIRLELKKSYADKIREVIDSAIAAHGNLTVAYFEAIETFGYKAWAEFDRHSLFNITWGAPAQEAAPR